MKMTDGLEGFKELRPTNVVAGLVTYIQEELGSFSGSREFIDILEKKKNENQHSLSFCVYMTNKCKSVYYFARENSQVGSSVIDIGVYKGSLLIFTIEAKLLPTPSGSAIDPRNDHEYVYGKGAGIQRFKDCKHGFDNVNNLLEESGLLGFMKEHDSNYWLKQINIWVNTAAWGKMEELRQVNSSNNDHLLSKHKRIDGSEIVLHHFLIDVT